ncbi:unnamed protein product, partial [Closterium sp. NIES-53]
MVLEKDLFRFYERLKESCARSGDHTLHVFVAGIYVDSAVALKILTDLLRADSLQYSVFPVYGYDDITAHANKAAAGNQAYTAVFLNCGATEDLCGLLGVGPSVSLFVLDCHRPVHLTNAALHNTKVVLAQSPESEPEDPFLARILADQGATGSGSNGDDSPWESDSDSASDSDSDGFSPGRGRGRGVGRGGRRPGGGGGAGGSEGEDDDDDDDDDDGFGGGTEGRKRRGRRRGQRGRRRRQREEERERERDPAVRARRRERRRVRLEYYNRGSFFGQPSGCVVFEMAHGMRRDTSEHLWLACVSITDQFVHSRLAPEHYTAGCLDLEEKVTTAAAMEAPRTAVMEDGVSVKLPDMGRIQFQHELRLMCLPRWNLFDSLLYSSYPATKLKTWTEPGLRRLRLLLGQLGIPHAQAKQRYPFMPAATRSRLKDDVQRFGPSHGLSDMCYRAFHRYNGYKFHVSASDVVYGITALLESHSPALTGLAGGDNGTAHAHTNDSFWTALSALHLRGWKQLEEGMDLAIRMQAALVRQGSLAIAKKGAIRSTCGRHRFRYMLLDDHSDARLIAHPLALTRLLLFLMDALKEQGERPRPMAVAASLPSSPSALIVGVSHKPRLGQLMG